MVANLNALTWEEVAALDLSKAVFVLPISSLEQHGWHLPLGTDDHILQIALDGLLRDPRLEGDMLFLPAIRFSCSGEHLDFPGTIALSRSTVVATVADLLECLQRHGARTVAIINSHGGNSNLLDAYSQEWEARYGIRIFAVHLWASSFFEEAARRYTDSSFSVDIHGGEIETSLLLYTMPKAVRTGRIDKKNDRPVCLPAHRSGWSAQELSPGNGVLGVPSSATAQKGKLLVDYMHEQLVTFLQSVAACAASAADNA